MIQTFPGRQSWQTWKGGGIDKHLCSWEHTLSTIKNNVDYFINPVFSKHLPRCGVSHVSWAPGFYCPLVCSDNPGKKREEDNLPKVKNDLRENFPGGTVGRRLPARAGTQVDAWSWKIPRAEEQLSLSATATEEWAPTACAHNKRSHCSEMLMYHNEE